MVYFVVINNRIMVTVEAETKKQAKQMMRTKLNGIPDQCLQVKVLWPGSPEAANAAQQCEVISQAELGLVYDSYVSAKNNAVIAKGERREAEYKLLKAETELREAKEREKDHAEWFEKKARELGMNVKYVCEELYDDEGWNDDDEGWNDDDEED